MASVHAPQRLLEINKHDEPALRAYWAWVWSGGVTKQTFVWGEYCDSRHNQVAGRPEVRWTNLSEGAAAK